MPSKNIKRSFFFFFSRELTNRLQKGEAYFVTQGNNLNSSLPRKPGFQEGEEQWSSAGELGENEGRGKGGEADELHHCPISLIMRNIHYNKISRCSL